MIDTATDADRDELAAQLGRIPRGVVGIAARCRCGRPLVVATAPRLDDGTPFPTVYYLTHPAVTAAVSRLEADGVMAEMTARLAEDDELAAGYKRAHAAYLRDRDDVGRRAGVGPVAEIDGISAGGMPTRVKCLHVLAAHALAVGSGVNPLGDETLDRIRQDWTPARCHCV